jgi:hypothetical protein
MAITSPVRPAMSTNTLMLFIACYSLVFAEYAGLRHKKDEPSHGAVRSLLSGLRVTV